MKYLETKMNKLIQELVANTLAAFVVFGVMATAFNGLTDFIEQYGAFGAVLLMLVTVLFVATYNASTDKG